ncbi:MAG TPA: TonB-dependent receptor [Phenylobacterium sp.]|uniref:TonB-dependent receptor n=1 Tax=Phenylobacterium sp. TaxID=1871053 RepID=UPI002B46E3C5|nr:TonB-dependent receptor [Phenylobacterium sp.]HKR88199.1 TonB-dependent receptor [Phenylobacterium sp.]HKT53477.1 TonB-dependent receptor [Caulobacteraceae bacterium]
MTLDSKFNRLRLLCSASLILWLSTGAAVAAEAAKPVTGVGGEGAAVGEVVVTAERNKAAADAPSKGSLEEMQPESIISRQFIEQVTPRLGDWTSVASIAPSMSGVTSNGGGIGEYNKLTMRGFQDGQFNVTFDGIAFGDTNDPTHHSASYFPASTIGAVVIDRGPGAAGDLGQANFGGAIHFFSLDPTDTFGVTQQLTFGSFNTKAAVTTINTGQLPAGGPKLVLNFDERSSDGELTHSGGYEANQMAKFVAPLGEDFTMTIFGAREETRFNLADAGPGATAQQVRLYGKDFALTAIPNDEHNYKFNYEYKTSDFEYLDLKGKALPTVTVEDQLYTYFYANKTTAANDITGLIGGPNTSPPNVTKPPQSASDIGGYDKLNEYRVWGNIVRINKDFSFGTLKVGGLTEWSSTNRHNIFVDLTLNGYPDNKFSPPKYPFTTNQKLMEDSKWFQWQAFADFYWTPTDRITIAPGFKYVHFERDVNAAHENTAGGSKNQPLVGSNTYTKPLYFLTANYRIRPDWSVYAQAATSFLVPSLSTLYVTGVNLQGLQPQTSVSYQAGTVFTHGKVTFDADIYRVDVDNLALACNVPSPTAANPNATAAGFCNAGKGRYTGVEGEGAYAFDFGLTVFANGSLNSAKTLATAANPAAGVAAAPAGTVPNAPKWTYAAGGIYHTGPWALSVSYKNSGAYVSDDGPHMSGYDSVDASVRYDVNKRLYLQLQAFNLADKREVTKLSSGLYQFQAGRTIEGTIAAHF